MSTSGKEFFLRLRKSASTNNFCSISNEENEINNGRMEAADGKSVNMKFTELEKCKIFNPLKRVNSSNLGGIDENKEDDNAGCNLGNRLGYNPHRLAKVIRSHASMLDLVEAGKDSKNRNEKGRERIDMNSEPSLSSLQISSKNVVTRILSDSNLVSAAGLSGDYVEADYNDSLKDVIVDKKADFPKDFTILRELGKGLCGTVYLARLHETKQLVAFKVMQKSKLILVGEEKHASDECRTHLDISNGPFISKLFHSYSDPFALYLLMEYAPCGDLFQCLVYHGLPSLQDSKVYVSQISAAIAYLHVKRYVYRDLKPENILLRANGDACLADFGMAKKLENLEDRAYSLCGTSQYMSPEVLSRRGCRFEADLWSMGILIYELCAGATPYANVRGNQELYEAVMNIDKFGGVWCPAWFDEETIDLVRKLLKCNESERLGAGGGDSMEKYFKHSWFSSCNLREVLAGAIRPSLQPRRRNIVYDLRLQNDIERGRIPWKIGV